MTLHVTSEIGRLRRVLVHRPGREIDWMVPSMMERLLFDDILYSDQARDEHDAFTAVLRAAGVETLDPEDLLAEVVTDPDVRGRLIARLERRGVAFGVLRQLETLAPAALATALVTGIRGSAGGEGRAGDRLRSFYRLPPVPNYFFQRDPQVVFGRRVLLAAMATDARDREPLLARTIFEHHPALAGGELLFLAGGAEGHPPRLEGGDVLVPAPEVLLVGLSERTNRRGIEALARDLRRRFAAGDGDGCRYLIVVEVPPRRSYMHLDTVFTFIDHGLCLAYLPVIAPGGAETGAVYRIDLAAPELAYTVCDDLPAALAEIGHQVELVPCGGGDLIDQQREQWTDGANAFTLAPGVIALYRRNLRTTEELARRGFRVLAEEDVIAGREEPLGHGPTVITLMDHELSRARGGPRCMTMPLERDDPS